MELSEVVVPSPALRATAHCAMVIKSKDETVTKLYSLKTILNSVGLHSHILCCYMIWTSCVDPQSSICKLTHPVVFDNMVLVEDSDPIRVLNIVAHKHIALNSIEISIS